MLLKKNYNIARFILISTLVLMGELTLFTTASCPNIISRSEWGSRSTAHSSPLTINPPTYVIIHHSATRGCTTKETCSALVKSFQNNHIDTRGWDDIGYNFLVGEDGNVYEGRGWGKTGAHAPNYNSKSIGICMIGDFTSTLPNQAALDAVKNLIACGVSDGKIKTVYRLLGHRQVRDTSCPGNSLYREIKSWPRWASQP